MRAAKMHASNLQDVIDIMRWGTGMAITEPVDPPRKRAPKKEPKRAEEPPRRRPAPRRIVRLEF